MRSRARLIEVLETVNECVIGWERWNMLMRLRDMMNGHYRQGGGYRDKFLADGRYLAKRDKSVHIRELATEALHYLNEDANADQG